MALKNSRIDRQLDLALWAIDALEPDLRPGIDMAARVQNQIRNIRGAGSRDRRFYRELIFTWFRYREWIDPFRISDKETAGLLLIALAHGTKELLPAKALLPTALGHSTPSDPENTARRLRSFDPEGDYGFDSLVPDWLASEFPAETSSWPHILERPPIWIRTDSEATHETVDVLRADDITASIQSEIPGAISVPTDSKLENTQAFQSGYFEIQDISSQAVLHQVDPGIGEHWFDACAGAGGKSLQLANLVGNSGKVTATDSRPRALEILRTRARRAHQIIPTTEDGTKITPGNLIILEPRNAKVANILYDGVLVDAPCSGSGTWRRRPFLRHQTDPKVIEGFTQTQAEILNLASDRVRPGGRLVYATCSLCCSENEDVIRAFLDDHDEFGPDPIPNRLNLAEIGPGRFYILPERFNGDSFYLATLRRKVPT